MLCLICKARLGNDLKGRKAHMRAYHNIGLEEKPVEYSPMDPKEKAEKVRRLEARLSGSVSLDDNGILTGYGVKTQEVDDCVSYIDDLKLDLSSNSFKKSENTESLSVNTLENKPVMSWEEFNQRMDALVALSESILKGMKEKYA